jgi:Bacterial Ig-like domain
MSKPNLRIWGLVALLASGITARSTASEVQQQRVGKSQVVVELREAEDGSTFAVRGLAKLDDLRPLSEERLKQLLVVRVQATAAGKTLPPLLGDYAVTDSELLFVSRYPLSTAVKYRVELAGSLTGEELSELVFAPLVKPLSPAPNVVAVYPSADVLPENVLKFYIHFSAPMSRGEAYKRIHLMHEGVEVKDPFLELSEELWDVAQTRFTLFIHPGRIKHGVKPREDSGLPMTDGKEYALQIDEAWLGADRQPLTAKHVKKFRVVAADEEQPNPVNWKIGTPKINSRQPVTLTFNEPLDHAMLNRVLLVRDPAGEAIAGKVAVTAGETVWSFEPEQPWKRSDYAIEIATNLEDLSGNSIARPFETKPQVEGTEGSFAPLIAIEFAVE